MGTEGFKALVVDDDADVLDALAEALAVDGYHVDTAANGAVALDKLWVQDYDLIVSDIRMPGLDGKDLYRTLAQHFPQMLRRLVLITADSLNRTTSDFLRQASVPVLLKPFDVDDLLRAAENLRQA